MENPGGLTFDVSPLIPAKNRLYPKDFVQSIKMPNFVSCFMIVKNHAF